MPRRQSLRDRKSLTAPPSPPSPLATTTRPRRTTATANTIVTRDLSDDEDEDGVEVAVEPRQTLRLTVKMPSSRLREATSAAAQDAAPLASTRSTRNIKKSYVVETSSEEEEDEEEQENYAEEDEVAEEATPNPEQGEDDEDDEEVEDDDAEAEMDADIDADGDIEMDDDADDGVPLGNHPPPPILKVNPPAAPKGKPVLTVKPAQSTTKVQTVEVKEMSMDEGSDDDEELSELGSEDDDEEEPADEDEDAEGEDVDVDADDDDDVDDEDDELAEGSDSRSPSALSRATTPDISKLTKRQRSRLNEVYTASPSSPTDPNSTPIPRGSAFLELPMEPQVKKHLTAEEHAMRRAEMARRRKNLSEKRNEEEKQDTINRLLKKQAPKRRGKISAREIEAQDRGDDGDEVSTAGGGGEGGNLGMGQGGGREREFERVNPVFVRWVSDKKGCRVGVPGEWIGGPMGEVFSGGGGGAREGREKMVVEVVEG